jgi:DNA polymerase Ligase (LigD)
MTRSIPAKTRFVILTHDWPVAHLDLFLEQNGVLRAWRLPADLVPGTECVATPNHDHRLMYLDYIGPVSGGRGTVERWDTGELEWLGETPERIEFRLHGTKLNGVFALILTEGSNWSFTPLPSAPGP